MENFTFSDIANAIGGILVLIFATYQICEKIFNNYGLFKKIKQKKEQMEEEKIKKHFKNFLDNASKEILDPLVEEFYQANRKQEETLKNLLNSSNDILRRNITKIYYKYLPYKKIPRYIKEELFILYKDYRNQSGNSFVKEIFEEMIDWQIVNSEKDIYETK